jgi:integrase
MASLRKKERSPHWFACFTLPDGRRVQRSTKETARKAAQAKADQWERLSKERSKARQAHKVISDIYRAAHKEELPDATTGSYFEGWLKRRKGEIAPASYSTYANRISHFQGWLGDFARRPLAEIETRHFIQYRDELAGRLSASSCNIGIKILRSVFEDARREGFVADNPARDCGMLKKEHGGTRRPFTVDELKSVLTAADEEWRSMILFGLYTGQRLGDLARLTWANVDLQAQEIQLRTAKTGRMMRIPISKPLMEHLESLPAGDDPKQPLHTRAAALATVNGSTLSRQFGELLAAVGLTTKKTHEPSDEERKGRTARRAASELSFHSLRHTATSLMKNAGISPAIVQDIIGHESAEISAHYTHIESDAKRKALDSLPDFFTTTTTPKNSGVKIRSQSQR